MILRLSFLVIFFSINLFALTVLVTKESFNFEEKIDIKKIKQKKFSVLNKSCDLVKISDLNSEEYITTHYINRGSILCKRDIKIKQNKSVIFKFGSIQIEKKGRILFENEKFIRIKRDDGKIEKIYKDGFSR